MAFAMAFNTPPITPGHNSMSLSTPRRISLRVDTQLQRPIEDLPIYRSKTSIFRNSMPLTPASLAKLQCEEAVRGPGPMTPLKEYIGLQLLADEQEEGDRFLSSASSDPRFGAFDVYRDPLETVKALKPTPKPQSKRRAILAPVEIWDENDFGLPGRVDQLADYPRTPLHEMDEDEIISRGEFLKPHRVHMGLASGANYDEQENGFLVDSVPVEPQNSTVDDYDVQLENSINEALSNTVANMRIDMYVDERRSMNTPVGVDDSHFGSIDHFYGAPSARFQAPPATPQVGPLHQKITDSITDASVESRIERARGVALRNALRRRSIVEKKKKKATASASAVASAVSVAPRAPVPALTTKKPLFDNLANIAAGEKALRERRAKEEASLAEAAKVRPYPVDPNLPSGWMGYYTTWEQFNQIFTDFERNCYKNPGMDHEMAVNLYKLRKYWFAMDSKRVFIRKWTHFNLEDEDGWDAERAEDVKNWKKDPDQQMQAFKIGFGF